MESMTNPTMLNNFLWYAVFNDSRNAYTATYSLFQGNKPIQWTSYPMDKHLQHHHPSPDIPTMLWFSNRFYICRQKEDTLIYYLTKFGPFDLEADSLDEKYLFYYRLYKADNTWKLDMNKAEVDPSKALQQLSKKIIGN